MTSFIGHLLPAAALGLFAAIPFGPIGLMCVQRTLAFGIRFGIASGMGAATAHGMFSSLAVVSGTALTQVTLALHTPLRITGGIVLVLMGLRTILVSTDTANGSTCGDPTCGDLFSAYTSTLLIAAANPMTILPYLGVTSALETGKPLIIGCALATPIGVMLGSASWYLFLALSTNTMFRSLQKAALDWFNKLTGVLLIALGASLCARIV
ncbi:LysE family translocator [Bradyrhizobium murdochi]|uniref:LysE family translocator n=1 Tax=Bradyrhizobium murdochi TaxID=1038859 RepID=UPI0003FAC0B1|nr:LysE family transporter [Bradyrhizobium murdochi]